jgi:hypothetical protein
MNPISTEEASSFLFRVLLLVFDGLRLRQFLSNNTTLSSAADLWVESPLPAHNKRSCCCYNTLQPTTIEHATRAEGTVNQPFQQQSFGK